MPFLSVTAMLPVTRKAGLGVNRESIAGDLEG